MRSGRRCGKLLGIELMDSVIVSKTGYSSLKELGLFYRTTAKKLKS